MTHCCCCLSVCRAVVVPASSKEVTLAGMSHLLRTVLAKGGPRENAAASSTTEQNLGG